jgi:hypothetical protein
MTSAVSRIREPASLLAQRPDDETVTEGIYSGIRR